jgi:hypothetical protein
VVVHQKFVLPLGTAPPLSPTRTRMPLQLIDDHSSCANEMKGMGPVLVLDPQFFLQHLHSPHCILVAFRLAVRAPRNARREAQPIRAVARSPPYMHGRCEEAAQ